MIRPQDVILLLKFFLLNQPSSQAKLSRDLFISTSEINAGIKRLARSHLIAQNDGRWCVERKAFQEFLVSALPYVFPAQRGAPAKGMLVAPSLDIFDEKQADIALQPVWPMEEGQDFGFSLLPLYPSVPKSAACDQALYQWLSIVDLLRDWQNPQKQQALDWVTLKVSGKRLPSLKSRRQQALAAQQMTLL